MKKLLPLAFVAMFLYGCPDSKLPSPPPKVPEPKLAINPPLDAWSVTSYFSNLQIIKLISLTKLIKQP